MITRQEPCKATSPEVSVCAIPFTKPLSEKQMERIETIRKEIDKMKCELGQLLAKIDHRSH
jgi:hypothetical protein